MLIPIESMYCINSSKLKKICYTMEMNKLKKIRLKFDCISVLLRFLTYGATLDSYQAD